MLVAAAQRPRILVVHPRISFINPTTELWPELFAGIGPTTFFGPGYQTETTLSAGLEAFVADRNYQFDLVVVSEQVTNPNGEAGSPDRVEFLVRNYGYGRREAMSFLMQKASWLEFINQWSPTTLYTFFEFDPYRVYPEWVHRMEESQGYLVGWGSEFVRPTIDLPNLRHETFGERATDLWFELLESRRSSVLSLPAFVSDGEFCLRPLSERRKDWSVLGTAYAARREARGRIREGHLSSTGNFHAASVAVVDRLSGGRIGNRYVRNWMRFGFRQALTNSKASFTCGSGLEYPVRKYFEIPAAGALLVSPDFPALGALGFRSGTNFVAASPEDIPSLTRDLLNSNPDHMQEIADAGQLLVREQHTLHARMKQLDFLIDSVLKGTFSGSRWIGGELRLLNSSEEEPADSPAKS